MKQSAVPTPAPRMKGKLTASTKVWVRSNSHRKPQLLQAVNAVWKWRLSHGRGALQKKPTARLLCCGVSTQEPYEGAYCLRLSYTRNEVREEPTFRSLGATFPQWLGKRQEETVMERERANHRPLRSLSIGESVWREYSGWQHQPLQWGARPITWGFLRGWVWKH